MPTHHCDLLVVGSGAAGLTAAITARKLGLNVVIAEKASTFGGTSALSGGTLWVPGNPVAGRKGLKDDPDSIRTYLRHELGNRHDDALVDAFLKLGPEMVEFLERNSELEFVVSPCPDYHPDVEGAVLAGRSIRAAPYDGRRLGTRLSDLRMPIPEMMLWGRISLAPEDMGHVFKAAESLASFSHMAKLALRGSLDVLRHGRGARLTSGNALVARLARTVFDLEIPLWLDAPVEELFLDEGRIAGAWIGGDEPRDVRAAKGVLLATGGFSANDAMRLIHFPHAQKGHFSLVPSEIQGDGARLAIDAGGGLNTDMAQPSAYVPLSLVPHPDGRVTPFPHLVERSKPGFIAVDARGARFGNESASYHDFVPAMVEAARHDAEIAIHVIGGHRAVRKYGMGAAPPAPMPIGSWIRNGYLVRADTLEELARRIGVDPVRLARTVADYDRDAATGVDTAFGRGGTAYQRFMGDMAHQPNPCIAPIGSGPYYAVRIYPGDLATMIGLRTDGHGRVLDAGREPVAGLYAAGNDMASVVGGNYPGAGATLGPGMAFAYGAAVHAAGRATH